MLDLIVTVKRVLPYRHEISRRYITSVIVEQNDVPKNLKVIFRDDNATQATKFQTGDLLIITGHWMRYANPDSRYAREFVAVSFLLRS